LFTTTDPGVPETPYFLPSSWSALSASAVLPQLKHSLNLASSTQTSFARGARLSREKPSPLPAVFSKI
jgi:hypothetical protein